MVAVTPIDGVTWQPRRQEGRLMINAFVFILKPGLPELRKKSATGQCATGQALHSDSMNQLLLHVAAEWFHRLSFFCLALPGVCVHRLNHMIYHSLDKVSCQNCDASAKHFRSVYEEKLRVNTLSFFEKKKNEIRKIACKFFNPFNKNIFSERVFATQGGRLVTFRTQKPSHPYKHSPV